VWQPAIFIGVVTSALSLAGLRLGSEFGRRFGKPIEVIAGIILIGVGLRIVNSHLML